MVIKNLDFRSDTVTKPTKEMRDAAANADVGDDVYGEDATVNTLENISAEMFNKESALFVTSGTQGNAVAVLAHTQRGDEIILESRSHIYGGEVGGLAVLGSLMARTVYGERGWMKPEDLEAAIRPDNIHLPHTSLICVENTHNASGGTPLTPKQVHDNWEVAKNNNLGLHIDGARIFNASIALGVDVKEFSKYADTIMICLSKGLAAPIGSIVVGSNELIEKAKKYRKMLGGGMRQAGIIAAPGIIALTKMTSRLAEDHENAKKLSKGLEELGIKILYPVETNMVYIDFSTIGWTPEDWLQKCNKLGWKTNAREGNTRLCTHYGIEQQDIEAFLEGLGNMV